MTRAEFVKARQEFRAAAREHAAAKLLHRAGDLTDEQFLQLRLKFNLALEKRRAATLPDK